MSRIPGRGLGAVTGDRPWSKWRAPRVGPAVVASYGSAGTMAVPGTFCLAMVFLVAFVLYYFVNWKYLAGVWPLS